MLIDTDSDLTKQYYEECKKQIENDLEKQKQSIKNKEVVAGGHASSRNCFEVVDSSENYTVKTEKNKYVFPKSISAENGISGAEETKKHFQFQIIENQEKYIKEFTILSEYNKEFKTDFIIHQQMKEIALDYLNNFKNNWFFIGGQIGSGKTHLCIKILSKILENNFVSLQILKFSKAFKDLKSLSNKPEQIQLLDKFQKVDILYIDDLFNRVPTSSDINLLLDIIDYRYISNKTTIFSSQKHFEELSSCLDDENLEALFSRIFEKTANYIIDVPFNQKFDFRMKI